MEFIRRFATETKADSLLQLVSSLIDTVLLYSMKEALILLCRVASDKQKLLQNEILIKLFNSNLSCLFIKLYILLN